MYAQDARDGLELMKRLGFERFSVMGWSDGASTALLLASSQETMSFIRSIILWGGNSFVSKEDLDIREQMRDISVWSSRMRDPLVEIYGRDELQVMWSQWTDAIIRVYEEGGEICSKEKLNSIRCPTLLLHGAKDSLLPDFHLVYLKQHLGRQCTYHVFPNGKHNIHFQYANEFNAMVVEFLKNK
ncbi:valacyclovir hydrolase-like [Oscarella lobularis]|uniref:valacyclovir hydrolase-like n=1 Tax=Oscarella lobularis TaxID=121494 RepID=UPI0033133CF8